MDSGSLAGRTPPKGTRPPPERRGGRRHRRGAGRPPGRPEPSRRQGKKAPLRKHPRRRSARRPGAPGPAPGPPTPACPAGRRRETPRSARPRSRRGARFPRRNSNSTRGNGASPRSRRGAAGRGCRGTPGRPRTSTRPKPTAGVWESQVEAARARNREQPPTDRESCGDPENPFLNASPCSPPSDGFASQHGPTFLPRSAIFTRPPMGLFGRQTPWAGAGPPRGKAGRRDNPRPPGTTSLTQVVRVGTADRAHAPHPPGGRRACPHNPAGQGVRGS